MTSTPPPISDSPDIDRVVSSVIGEMSKHLVEESHNIYRVLEREITELGGDDDLLGLLEASIESNVTTVFHILEHGIPPDESHVPSAAMEYARRTAQHGIPVNALVRAYRLGQSTFLDRAFDRIAESEIEPGLGLRVSQRIMSVGSTYIDWISEQVVEAYQTERERWLSNRNAIRVTRIRELLSATTTVDETAASAVIGYTLAQRHCAMIAWLAADDHPDALARLERTTRDFAMTVGAVHSPLFVAADRHSAWVWIPLGTRNEPVDLGAARAFLLTEAASGLRVALGSPAVGSAGFRTSHVEALRARAIAAQTRDDRSSPLTSYTDPGLAAASLITADLPRAREWVREVLGPLAADTEHAQRLRDTLRTFLTLRSSHKRTAEVLHVHYNTIKYRVKAAEQERGRPLSEDRLDVEIALLAQHWVSDAIGSDVPTPP